MGALPLGFALLRDDASDSSTKSKKTISPSGTSSKNNEPDNFRKKIRVFSVMLILASVLLVLAMLSHTKSDIENITASYNNFKSLFTSDYVGAPKLSPPHNWLGIFGAMTSHFLFLKTIGYSVFFLPFFIIAWGLQLFQYFSIPKKLLKRTMAYFLVALFFASSMGSIASINWLPVIPREWFGAIGIGLGEFVSGIIGRIGSLLFFTALSVVVVIYLTEINIDQIISTSKEKYPIYKASMLSFLKKMFSKETYSRFLSDAKESIKNIDQVKIKVKEETVPEKKLVKEEVTVVAEAPKSVAEEPAVIVSKTPNNNAKEIFNSAIKIPQETEEPAKIIQRNLNLQINNNEKPPELVSEKDLQPEKKPESKINIVTNANMQTNPVTSDKAEEIASQFIQMKKAASTIDLGSAQEIIDKPAQAEPLAIDEKGKVLEPEKSAMEVTLEESEESKTIQLIDDDKQLSVTIHSAPKPEKELQDPLSSFIHDEEINYIPPPVDFLIDEETLTNLDEDELKENARILQEKLETFKIFIENLTITPGPVVTQYEFVPAADIKISKIVSLSDDIAMALKARGIRIIAPIPGKGTVGIEIPNKNPMTVRFSSIIKSASFQKTGAKLPLVFGKTISGDVYCADLTKMPHLLIAGATGAGKSVGINTIIASLLYKMHPRQLKFVIVDPKKVELSQYAALENHFMATSPDVNNTIITDPQEAVMILKSLCVEMDKRYDILAKVGQRNIFDYNAKVAEGKLKDDKDMVHREMPFIVVIIDELADLMLTASKEVETPIIRLAQLARAIGIHLVVATQRPSVNVITGLIKANFPARIAYLVASKVDSRTILDSGGADQLLGMGDMLFLPNGSPKPIRIQNAFISTDEVENICSFIGDQVGYSQPYMLPSINETDENAAEISKEDRDPLFEDAARLVIMHQQGSVSLIQRRLKVGYARAGRIVDELAAAGVVGPYDGSKARKVYMESESELEAVL